MSHSPRYPHTPVKDIPLIEGAEGLWVKKVSGVMVASTVATFMLVTGQSHCPPLYEKLGNNATADG